MWQQLWQELVRLKDEPAVQQLGKCVVELLPCRRWLQQLRQQLPVRQLQLYRQVQGSCNSNSQQFTGQE